MPIVGNLSFLLCCYCFNYFLRIFNPILLLHLIQHPQGKVLGPSRRGDNTIGNRLPQLGPGCPRFLRDREVLLKSGGTPHGNGAADPDQFAGLGIQDLFVLIIENLLADIHEVPSPSILS